MDSIVRIKNRGIEEQILLLLSVAAAIGISPFIFIRLLSEQWLHAVFNIALVLTFALNGWYIYSTRKVELARFVFATSLVAANLIGLYFVGLAQLSWAYPSLVAVFFTVRPNQALLFCLFGLFWIAVVSFQRLDIFQYFTYLVTLAFTCLFAYIFANITIRQQTELKRLSTRDSLTNVFNRRAFNTEISKVCKSKRKDKRTTMMIFDVDHFKNINDEFGHSIGDRVLVELTLLISGKIRELDRFYRIGGEEFAILMGGVSTNESEVIAEGIRSAVQDAVFAETHKITISTGIAEFKDGEKELDWFRRCDDALYLAKDQGRNQTVLSS